MEKIKNETEALCAAAGLGHCEFKRHISFPANSGHHHLYYLDDGMRSQASGCPLCRGEVTEIYQLTSQFYYFKS
jgi:hypothetical protein